MGITKKFRDAHRGMVNALAAPVSLVLGVSFGAATAHANIDTWTGTGGTSWATSNSWSPSGGPATGDTASFTDTGSGSTSNPGTVTSLLNTNRTIGGLSFVNTASHYHLLDLNTLTLIDTGNLNFNIDENANTTTTIRDGTLTVNGSFANVLSGDAISGTSISVVDLSGLTAFNATVQDFYVGVSSANGATGTMALSPTTTINATLMQVGVSTGSGDSTATLHLGKTTTATVGEFDVGKNNAQGTVDIASGGTLTLGSSTTPTSLNIGDGNLNTNSQYNSEINLAGGTFNGYFSQLIVGQKNLAGGVGGGSGMLVGATGGSVTIGTSGNTANFIVGNLLGTAGGANASGTVDFSALSTLNANLNTLSIGATTTGGNASGTVNLAQTSTINATNIVVGENGNGTDALSLGKNSTILAQTFSIGGDYSTANVTITTGGSLTLGSATQRTSLNLGNGTINTNNQFTGELNLTGAAFNAYLNQLVVGQKNMAGGVGGGYGMLVGAAGGAIDIGPTGNTANFIVGNLLGNGSGSASGTVDFSGVASLNANLNTLSIGITSVGGSAQGTVNLAQTNTINALTIVVGQGNGGTSNLALGKTSTILAPSFIIGQDYSSGSVTITSGGSLSLGSSAARTNLTICNGTINTNNQYSGQLNLTGAAFNGYLGNVIVGQESMAGGVGGGTGTFIAGSSGSVDIGAAGNTANLYVGRLISTSGGSADGTVDFSGLSTLNANLNSIAVGVSTNSNASVQGILKLAQTNTINALSIIVGSSGGSSDSLVLGNTNTILTNQLNIGQDYSTGSVTIPAGGTLALGSATQRANLTIGVGVTNTNSTYGGTLDLANATVTAYLGAVTIGSKDTNPGAEVGTFNISNYPANYVNATSILLGGPKSTSTLNFGGGVLYAGSIAKGSGTANFNWTGGQLGVGTFGTSTTPFNLTNSGGTLAPATATGAIGTTQIYGNYTQGSAASMAIRIAGNSPSNGNDQVNITGSATLAGSLNLSVINSFAPAVGQSFLIATYGSESGAFGFVAPPSLPSTAAFQLDYSSPTQLYLRIVNPVPQNYVSTSSSGNLGTAGSWNNAAVPGTASALSITNSGSSPQTITVGTSMTVHSIALSGLTAAENLQVPQGVQLGVANQITIGANSTLSGGGTVLGNVAVGSGMIQAGAGSSMLTITGNLAAQQGSVIGVDLPAPGSLHSDAIDVQGALALGGTLDVQDPAGYTPQLGDTFQILNFGSASGHFSNVILPSLSAGLAWDTSQLTTDGSLSVTGVPEPAAMGLLAVSGIGLLRRRRRALA